MQLPSTKKFITIAEYLAFENAARERHEYRDGEIIAMAGNTANHSLVAVNFMGELRAVLKGKPCRVYDSNLRYGIPGTPLYAYSDLSVICGAKETDAADKSGLTFTNPRVLVEILSASTEAYDRGEKFTRYRKLKSLEDYILVSQDSPSIEIFHRQADGSWVFSNVSGMDAFLRIISLQVEMALAEIYSGAEFPPPLENQ